MKVEATEQDKVFEPITLTITIESKEELCNLWHRFNLGNKTIKESASCNVIFYDLNSEDHLLIWKELNAIVEQKDLKNNSAC